MRILNALLCSCLSLLLAGPALAGELSPSLEMLLAEKADDAPLTVLVVMRDRVDIKTLDQSLHDQEVDLATRHVTVIETLKSAATTAQANLLTELEISMSKAGGEITKYTPHWLINAVVVTGTEAAIRQIAARDDVEVVEPNLVPQLIEPVSSEVGSDKRSIGITPGVVNIGARRVWDELGIRGEGALIGSLDTGVDGNHPALSSRWRGNHAPADECWLDVVGSASSFPSDYNSHGTHCTGTMCGLAANDTIGVAPGAEWIAANAIDQGAGGGFDTDIITCFEWFADPDGDPTTMEDVPDVVQNSWGVHEGFGYPDCDSRWWDVMDACEAAGPVIVFAAGNEGPGSQTLRSPADRATSLYNAFAVGATSPNPPYSIAGFSSRGPAGPNCGPEEYRIKPELSAPGVNIYSSVPGGGYSNMSGTSMACPHVAGVVALMRSANPNIDVITIKEVLMATTTDLGDPGEDNTYGHGFIDAFAAVEAVMVGFGAIEGTVTDAVTGAPVVDADVDVVDGYQHTKTDGDGHFSLVVPQGNPVLLITTFGYEDLFAEIQVSENETVVVDLTMQPLPQVTLSGRVYQPGGNPVDGGVPVAGALVKAKDTPVPAVATDSEGYYNLIMPASTSYRIQVTAGTAGYLDQLVPFGADLALDFFLDTANTEGFEAGDMSERDWFMTGGAEWSAQSDEVYSGNFAAKSGPFGDTNFAQMQIFEDCGSGGEVAFWFKVSSQAGDFLRFYVGNDLVAEWSGEVDWTYFSYPVESGVESFRWRYQKDHSGAAGEDCAWIDDIVIPGGGSTTPLLVAAPTTLAVEIDGGTQTSAKCYLFNMGGGNLNWTLNESADWLTVTPSYGTLAVGHYRTLSFDFDAMGQPEGVHSALATIDSNDPANPVMNLQAQMTVGTVITDISDGLPQAFGLLGAVPNPFNPMTTVRFNLPAGQYTELAVYDVRGHLVQTLLAGQRPAGLNEVRWDGRDLSGRAVSSGTYFARLKAGGKTSVKSLTLVR